MPAPTKIENIFAKRYFYYTETLTNVAAATETTFTGGPNIGTIVSFTAYLSAGTGVTIQPAFGNIALWTIDQNGHLAQLAIAQRWQVSYSRPVYFTPTPGTLYVRWLPNAGADNTISYQLVLMEGA